MTRPPARPAAADVRSALWHICDEQAPQSASTADLLAAYEILYFDTAQQFADAHRHLDGIGPVSLRNLVLVHAATRLLCPRDELTRIDPRGLRLASLHRSHGPRTMSLMRQAAAEAETDPLTHLQILLAATSRP